ncbi:MAG TPA: nucleotide exchange factor GrpE [Acidimicrobiales bacterium]
MTGERRDPGRQPDASGAPQPVSDAGTDDAERVRAEIAEPDHDDAAFGTGAGAASGGDPEAGSDASAEAGSDAGPEAQAEAGSAAGGPGPSGPGEAGADAGRPGGADAGGDGFDEAAAALEVDIERMHKERQEFLEAARRTQADFENFRKQAQKRQDEAVQRALGRLIEGLLPVLDACDAAVAHGEGEAVEPVVKALYGALEKEGLERIDPAGEPFDPAEAEAVLHEPGEGGQQVVAEVMRAGYRWRGRVLRPAMVKVTD